MRTTITLDPDVEALVKKLMRDRRMSFKDAVNASLRKALTARPTVDLVFPTFDLGVERVDTTHALQVASILEDDEIVRELSTGR